jgi:hypothetical protein
MRQYVKRVNEYEYPIPKESSGFKGSDFSTETALDISIDIFIRSLKCWQLSLDRDVPSM